MKYLEGNVLPEDQIRFKRGIVYSDGRLDLCKQGLGTAVPMITKALEKNDKIQHFLIGNDVVGRSGAEAIGKMVSERSPETLYLAGNELDGEGRENSSGCRESRQKDQGAMVEAQSAVC